MKSETAPQEHPTHEPGDLHARAVLRAAGAVIATVLLAAAVAAALTRHTTSMNDSSKVAREPTLLSSAPGDDRAAFEREKRLRLESYGWVDEKEKIAHIPIEHAMNQLSAPASSAQERR
jgi:hypothetical protein